MGNANGKPVVFTDEVNLNHFRLLRVVGKGAFGKVRIVERKDTGLTFALKYIRKDEVVRSESVRNIIRERRMLEHLNHPFLCNLRYSFQDIEYLYIVVDLMNGGDLRFHISRKTFTEEAVKFWIAELSCAVLYIHGRGIVHRDIKPDNILLDADGHVHLADFNVASEIHTDRPLTSRSGTLAYLAPEVYAGNGYGRALDWWSLGVVFYECIYGRRPFTSDTHESLAQEIMRASPKYPTTNPPVSGNCNDALRSLLEKDVRKRIGAYGFDSFTSHPFFADIDFAALERKEYEPVFKPSREKTNFDATYDLEELLLEEAPLEARARRQRPRERLKDDATTQEKREDELHKMIETLFEPFDYTTVQYDKYTGTGNPPDWVKPSGLSGTCPVTIVPNEHRDNPQSKGSGSTRVTSPSLSGSPPIPSAERTEEDTAGGTEKPQLRTIQPTVPQLEDKRSLSKVSSGAQGTRFTTTGGGGVQVVLNENGPWTDLNNKDAAQKNKASGVLGFLSKRRGRASSPKPQECGVLGREGARQVVG
ncbi:kinase-like domain-containing protein [Terfezia claveryi]|nr:kinase-like domain-containing protein [Terfezia claveryi]